MKNVRQILLTCVFLAIPAIATCDSTRAEWKGPNMTKITPQLQSMFEKTKTICFGRFLVDVPASAITAWGKTNVPLDIMVYPEGRTEVKNLEKNFIDELANEKAIYLGDIPLLIAVEEVFDPKGRIVSGYDGFQAIKGLKIYGFFHWKSDAFTIKARPLTNEKDDTIAEIKGVAHRLRQHKEGDIPVESGNCIEYPFLPDEMGGAHEGELVRIGFRLKEFPDTHLSIFVGPSNPHYSDSDSLKWQLERFEAGLRAENPRHPNLKTKYLRRGERHLDNWGTGFEALSHTPEQQESHGIHDFAMDFRGVAADPLKPYLDVRMQTGVADNAAGAIKPILTDAEAVAVWDKITSTIRVRPTTNAAAKPTQFSQASQYSLGELAATGRLCPESGWWQAEKTGNAKEAERRHIKKGDVMPHATVLGEQSLWQKLRKEQPVLRTATMWKLIRYDEAAAQINIHREGSIDSTSVSSNGRKG
jgi:hypothetical protein